MKKIILILTVFSIISHCSLNKVTKKHGVRNLESKKDKITVNQSNSNDIKFLLGPPSTKSTFDNDLWIYIEREITSENVLKLGKKKLSKNNILILELDKKGIIIEKLFYDLNNINNITFSSNITDNDFAKKSFVYDFLSSMRQKINDPLGKRKKP
jgi:outer membrane protein assembly factor BamE (lipoprotein component of BamABCDE complex)